MQIVASPRPIKQPPLSHHHLAPTPKANKPADNGDIHSTAETIWCQAIIWTNVANVLWNTHNRPIVSTAPLLWEHVTYTQDPDMNPSYFNENSDKSMTNKPIGYC